MYITNFIICFSFLFIISTKLTKRMSHYKCHNEAITHLFKNALKKTLDKSTHYSVHNTGKDCRFISFKKNNEHFAIGRDVKQKLSLSFKGKTSND